MSEEKDELAEQPEELQEPPLAHIKLKVIIIGALLAGLFLFDMGSSLLGWTTFYSVGLAINASAVFAVLMYLYPRVAIGISLFMLLLGSWVGDIGYWLSGISVIVYFLTAFRPKKKIEDIESSDS